MVHFLHVLLIVLMAVSDAGAVEGYTSLTGGQLANYEGCSAGGWTTGRTLSECAAACTIGGAGKVCYSFSFNLGTTGCQLKGACDTNYSAGSVNSEGWVTYYRNANNGSNCPDACAATNEAAATKAELVQHLPRKRNRLENRAAGEIVIAWRAYQKAVVLKGHMFI